MSRTRRRRRPLRPVPVTATVAAAGAVAAAVVLVAHGGASVTLHDAANAATPLKASYQASDSWGTGYSGQYTITNPGTAAVNGWALAFTLPKGTTISSLWDGSYTDNGGQVTVKSDSWDAALAPAGSVTVGFVTQSAGPAGQPAGCTINGAPCQGGTAGTGPTGTGPSSTGPSSTGPLASSSPFAPAASPTPSRSAPLSPSGSATASPAKPATTPSSPASSAPASSAPASSAPASSAPASSAPASSAPLSGAPAAGTAGFGPYVDTSLYPPFSLTATAKATGVKQFNLAFVVAGGAGACTPEWGGATALGADPVAAQIGALRAMGGDVRISFGGQAGSELAVTCTSAAQLQAAYQSVISAYDVNKLDFDIEGAAVANAAANARRDQALAALEAANPGLQVSYTLPVLPSGLTSDGDAVLTGAVKAGVKLSAVNVMAMDYGDGAAPNPSGQMGTFAIDAATATDAQVASALGISIAAAWPKVAVTPMIGVNDTSTEVFTVANAQQLAAFAASKHLAWLSMWSAARDTQCPGGAQGFASPTCSSIVQSAGQFMNTLGAY